MSDEKEQTSICSMCEPGEELSSHSLTELKEELSAGLRLFAETAWGWVELKASAFLKQVEKRSGEGAQFILSDAITYLKEHGKEYDFIHASPPCQGYSHLTPKEHKGNYEKLIDVLRVRTLSYLWRKRRLYEERKNTIRN